jgi:hypothetical protein
MRYLFYFSATVSFVSGLLLAASVAIEVLDRQRVFAVTGTELTVTFSVPDRIFLSLFIVGLIFTAYFWTKVSGRG